MSDQLTTSSGPPPGAPDAPAVPAPGAAARPDWRGALLQAVVVVVGFAVVGAICGLIWEALWSPAPGAVVKHVWYPLSWDRAQPAAFAGTGWFVVISIVAGALLGALAAWRLDRAELVTLAAVAVGGVLAAYLMREVGLHRSPADPQHLAKTAADGTRLPSSLRLSSWGVLAAFPGAGLAGLATVLLTVSKRVHTD
jgi:hypothetical protein